jgi:multidrug resistance efflux pump
LAELTPEEKTKQMDADLRAADAKRRADAEEKERMTGETLDKCLAALDNISKRVDAWEAQEKAKADAEAAAREPSDPKPLAADS